MLVWEEKYNWWTQQGGKATTDTRREISCCLDPSQFTNYFNSQKHNRRSWSGNRIFLISVTMGSSQHELYFTFHFNLGLSDICRLRGSGLDYTLNHHSEQQRKYISIFIIKGKKHKLYHKKIFFYGQYTFLLAPTSSVPAVSFSSSQLCLDHDSWEYSPQQSNQILNLG